MTHLGNPKNPAVTLENLLYSNAMDQFLKAIKEDHSHLWHETAITINGVDFNWADLRMISEDFRVMSRIADTELHVQKRELERHRVVRESVQSRRWKAMDILLKARKAKEETVDRVTLEKALGVPQPKVDNSSKKV